MRDVTLFFFFFEANKTKIASPILINVTAAQKDHRLFSTSVLEKQSLSIGEEIACTSLLSSKNTWNHYYSSRHHILRKEDNDSTVFRKDVKAVK